MPKPPSVSSWQSHVLRWSDCRLCPLCEERRKIVLARGQLPCDVLFIGEAPGASEDCLGEPFVGPAGHLFDSIIAASIGEFQARHFFTNLVACIPRDGDDPESKKLGQPPKESIITCSPRVKEVYEMANPKLTVCVGKLSAEWVRKLGLAKEPIIELIHPAAIIRAPIQQKGLMVQRASVILRDGYETYVGA